jgi:hypothetical protein
LFWTASNISAMDSWNSGPIPPTTRRHVSGKEDRISLAISTAKHTSLWWISRKRRQLFEINPSNGHRRQSLLRDNSVNCLCKFWATPTACHSRGGNLRMLPLALYLSKTFWISPLDWDIWTCMVVVCVEAMISVLEVASRHEMDVEL